MRRWNASQQQILKMKKVVIKDIAEIKLNSFRIAAMP
jgi:hypothetical protein